MKTKRIIINSDDLGISFEVNAAIENAIMEGCISSTSIMANAPTIDDAIRIAKKYPQISFGVHLNVDEFAPLTKPKVFRKYQIVDESGLFKKEVLHVFNTIDNELAEAIYEEWKAQLDKVISNGVVPSHVDSHEYTHGIVGLQDVLIRLLKEYGITKVRRKFYTSIPEMIVNRGLNTGMLPTTLDAFSSNNAASHQKHSFVYRRLMQLKDGYRHRQWIKKMRKEGFVMTDFFDSYQMFLNAYPKLLKYGNYATVELMTHPGHPGYRKETEQLMQKELMKVCKYELINYKDL